MLAIVLGILKIIGILLLVILGLLLFVILSVLFVPVRYRAEGSVYEHLKGSASVSWFLHLIFLKVSYDGEAQMDFRILWFHPGREKDGEEESEENGAEALESEDAEPATEQCPADAAEDVTEHVGIAEAENTDADALEQELTERVETAEVSVPTGLDRNFEATVEDGQVEEKAAEHLESAKSSRETECSEAVKSEAAVQKTEIGEVPKTPETETPDDADSKLEKSRFRLSAIPERIRKCIANLKARIHRIFQRFKKIARKFRQGKAQWETIQAFIRDEENKKAFCLAKRQIFAIIRHILPQKLEGKIHFGFGDPYTTGQVLTWISPFYGLYGRHVQVCPDFMEPCLDGELKLKGRIRLGTLLFLVFRMLQNKQIRLWIKKWRES